MEQNKSGDIVDEYFAKRPPKTAKVSNSRLIDGLYAKFDDFKTGCPNSCHWHNSKIYCEIGDMECCVEKCFVIKKISTLGI